MTEQTLEEKINHNVKALAVAIVLALAIRSIIFEPFNIPSGSMIPTLLIGDYIVVSKPTYGYSKYSFPFGSKVNYFEGRKMDKAPQQGDVVVFRPVVQDDTDFIKRVIGVGGDRVQMREGILYVNDVACLLEKTDDYQFVDDDGKHRTAEQYTETLPNGVKHPIIKQVPFGQSPYDNTPVYVVPEGHYFMVGDNRDGSEDSRGQKIVGFIPHENLIGEAQFIFFSTGGAPLWQVWKWAIEAHYNRIFTGIH